MTTMHGLPTSSWPFPLYKLCKGQVRLIKGGNWNNLSRVENSTPHLCTSMPCFIMARDSSFGRNSSGHPEQSALGMRTVRPFTHQLGAKQRQQCTQSWRVFHRLLLSSMICSPYQSIITCTSFFKSISACSNHFSSWIVLHLGNFGGHLYIGGCGILVHR